MKFDLLIFDCDGVLVDSERLVNAIESQHLSRLGLSIGPEEARMMFKGKTVAEIAMVVESTAQRKLPVDWLYDWGMATALGFVRDLREVRGVREVLERLAHGDARTCVAPQSPLARVKLSLLITGLDWFFGDRIYTAAMVARGKPAPDLFLYAAEQMGAHPSNCAVIEDSENGVHAARAAGMSVFGYVADEDSTALSAAGAIVFDSMQKLPSLLGFT